MSLLKGAGVWFGMWALFAGSYAFWTYGLHSDLGVSTFQRMEMAFNINIPPQGLSEWSAALVAFSFVSLIAIGVLSIPFRKAKE